MARFYLINNSPASFQFLLREIVSVWTSENVKRSGAAVGSGFSSTYGVPAMLKKSSSLSDDIAA
jgi:hypothetical protein